MADEPTIQNNVDAATAEFEARKAEREAAGGGVVQSPMDAKTMGANADQAKMIGSQPKSLQEAADQARMQREAAQEMQYDAIMREKQLTEAQLTPEQKDAQKLQEQLTGLGTLDGLVQQYVNQAGQAAETEAIQAGVKFDLPDATPEEKEALAGIEDDYASYLDDLDDPNVSEEDAQRKLFESFTALQAEGAMYEGESATSILATLETMVDANPEAVSGVVGKAFAEGMVDPADMSLTALSKTGMFDLPEDLDAPIEELGGLSSTELAGIFGEDWATMSVADIGKVVENESLKNANQSANIGRQLADPNVSPALKELLNEKQAQIEASGMAQIEADAEQAADNVLAAGSVLFNGEVQDIDDLLSDSGIQGIVADFLSDPEKMDEHPLFKNNPQFANMIKNTFQGGLEAAEAFDDQVEGFKTLQKDIMEKRDSDIQEMSNINVNPSGDVLKMFGLEDGKLHAATPELNVFWESAKANPAVIETMNNWNAETREQFGEWMNSASEEELAAVLPTLENPQSAMAFMDITNIEDRLAGIPKGSDGEYAGLMNLLLGASPAGISGGNFANALNGVKPEQMLDRIGMELGTGSAAYKQLAEVFDTDPTKFRANIQKVLGSEGLSMTEISAKAAQLSASRKSMNDGAKLGGSITAGSGINLTAQQARNRALDSGAFKNGQWDVKKLGELGHREGPGFADALIASGLNLNAKVKGPHGTVTVKDFLKNNAYNAARNSFYKPEVIDTINKVRKQHREAILQPEAARFNRGVTRANKKGMVYIHQLNRMTGGAGGLGTKVHQMSAKEREDLLKEYETKSRNEMKWKTDPSTGNGYWTMPYTFELQALKQVNKHFGARDRYQAGLDGEMQKANEAKKDSLKPFINQLRQLMVDGSPSEREFAKKELGKFN